MERDGKLSLVFERPPFPIDLKKKDESKKSGH